MFGIKLPFWMNGTEALKLAAASESFWAWVKGLLDEAAKQLDISQCSMEALKAHAIDRHVERLPGESVASWRTRVQHALATAQKSGSRAGLEYILTVYGVSAFDIQERVPSQDWDIIDIVLDPDALSGASTEVLDKVFAKFGNTCRRFQSSHYQLDNQYCHESGFHELQHIGKD